jgi:hypothetical protein
MRRKRPLQTRWLVRNVRRLRKGFTDIPKLQTVTSHASVPSHAERAQEVLTHLMTCGSTDAVKLAAMNALLRYEARRSKQ